MRRCAWELYIMIMRYERYVNVDLTDDRHPQNCRTGEVTETCDSSAAQTPSTTAGPSGCSPYPHAIPRFVLDTIAAYVNPT